MLASPGYLLVSELVSNAIVHGDPGGGLDAPSASAGVERDGGWGLLLVERTADRWGSVQGEEHCVWFELDRAGGGQPDAGRTDTATPA